MCVGVLCVGVLCNFFSFFLFHCRNYYKKCNFLFKSKKSVVTLHVCVLLSNVVGIFL